MWKPLLFKKRVALIDQEKSGSDRLLYNQSAHTWIEIRLAPAEPVEFRSVYNWIKGCIQLVSKQADPHTKLFVVLKKIV